MAEETANGAGAGTAKAWGHSPCSTASCRGQDGPRRVQKAYARDLVGRVRQPDPGRDMTVAKDTVAMIKARIAQIDELLSEQLNEIMHAPRVPEAGSLLARPALPGEEHRDRHHASRCACSTSPRRSCSTTWRRPPSSTRARCSRRSTRRSTAPSAATRSALLVGDYEFGRHPQDMALLEKISNVAAAAHAPFIAGGQPASCSTWTASPSSAMPRDLAKIFETPELIKWRSFRDSEDSRYVGPGAAARPDAPALRPGHRAGRGVQLRGGRRRHGPPQVPVGQRRPTRSAQRITDAFAQYGWCAAIRGVEGGGLVEGLPAHTFSTDEGDVALKCPTEIAITDRREKELADLGFIALVPLQGHRLRRVLRRPDGQQAEDVRHRLRPTPTPASRRSCRTSWPSRASPTTSRR